MAKTVPVCVSRVDLLENPTSGNGVKFLENTKNLHKPHTQRYKLSLTGVSMGCVWIIMDNRYYISVLKTK